ARADRALLARAGRTEPGHARPPEARLAERRLPAQPAAGRVRAAALPLARRARERLAARSRSCDRAARAGEDRALRPVPGLRALLLRARLARRRRPGDVRRRARPAPRGRAVGRADDRGGAARARRRPRREAAGRVPADPAGGDRLEGLPGPVREPELLGRDETLRRLSA